MDSTEVFAVTLASHPHNLEARKGRRRSTYFEQYGGTHLRNDNVLWESGEECMTSGSRGLAYPDPRVNATATAVPPLRPSETPKAVHIPPNRSGNFEHSKRPAVGVLSIDPCAARSGVLNLTSTAPSTLSPSPTLTPPLTPPAMLSPLHLSTSRISQSPRPSLDEASTKHASVDEAPKMKTKVVVNESARTRRWAEEMLRYQDHLDAHSASTPARRSSTEKSPPRRESLAPVTTDLMDSFISELNPDSRLESPRFPPLTPLSPWDAYSEKARGSRSSSRQRSKDTARDRNPHLDSPDRFEGETNSRLPEDLGKQTLSVPSPPQRSSSPYRQSSVRSTSSRSSAAVSIPDIIQTRSPSLRDSGSPRPKIPTIDEIVKRHAGAAQAAHVAARKSILSNHTSSNPSTPVTSPLPSPHRPVIAVRTSSHAGSVVGTVPPRSSSRPGQATLKRSADSIESNVVASQALLKKLAAVESDDYVPEELPASKVTRPASSLRRSTSNKSSSPSFASSQRFSGIVEADFPGSLVTTPTDPATHNLALYLHSPRLTKIIKVPGSPELSVSIADVGSAYGKPIFVFLGLGCVRYLIALFDELAETLGLRLICVDRWGLGKTDDVPQERRTLLEWARVVEHVADELGIEQFGLLAHSAGAPYALATALRLGSRIVGTIHLLSPWVSSDINGGYKWLKWVPNSVIKTAQAAEWRLQGWALGKPPPVTYNPIEFNAFAPVSSEDFRSPTPPPKDSFEEAPRTRADESFDDLADFQGRFGPGLNHSETFEVHRTPPALGKRVSKSFLGSLFKEQTKITHNSEQSLSPPGKAQAPTDLTSLRAHSEGSINSRVGSMRSSLARSERPSSAVRQPSLGRLEFGLEEDFAAFAQDLQTSLQRSMSFSSRSSSRTCTSRPMMSRNLSTGHSGKAGGLDGAAFGTALLQASHAESLAGGTADLMSILGRDSTPWGFAYTDIEQPCKIWYGSNDDKISEKSMLWCERCMDAELIIVPGEGHNLMTSSRVMLEVLDSLLADNV